MTAYSLPPKLRRAWNWIRGKRIIPSDYERGRVLIRTGQNSSNRSNGGQWYLLRYQTANGQPSLPRFSRGRLDKPVTLFEVAQFTGEELAQARRWYEVHYGALDETQELMLVCIYEPNGNLPGCRIMGYRPNELFELEHPWLSSRYSGAPFPAYFGTWYGSGKLKETDIMDFEISCQVKPGSMPLPPWGASWR